MNDPHVVSLQYRLSVVEDGLEFKNPPPMQVKANAFNGSLSSGEFTATMIMHFPSTNLARVSVDAYLKNWEAASALKQQGLIRFDFVVSTVIDRDPMPASTGMVHAAVATAQGSATVNARASVTRAKYPDLPMDFVLTPNAETLLRRNQNFEAGREPIFGMANFADTFLRSLASGTRGDVEKTFAIDKSITRKIGELCANRGGDLEGRKAGTIPAVASEIDWLKVAVRKIIIQVGVTEGGVKPQPLRMSDLPSL